METDETGKVRKTVGGGSAGVTSAGAGGVGDELDFALSALRDCDTDFDNIFPVSADFIRHYIDVCKMSRTEKDAESAIFFSEPRLHGAALCLDS